MSVLAVIGNPRGEGYGFSEGEAWRTVERYAEMLMQTADDPRQSVPLDVAVRDAAHQLRLLARTMRRQADRGVHVNPRRNPAGARMSENVQAIVYRHKKDGECYIHAFGNGKVTQRDLDLLSRMSCLKDRTQVQMIAEPDGSLSVVGANGQPLWKEF